MGRMAVKLAWLKYELRLDEKFDPEYYYEHRYDLNLCDLIRIYEWIYQIEFGELPQYGKGRYNGT